jgi:capsular exopolysaccharide synthesis family protein
MDPVDLNPQTELDSRIESRDFAHELVGALRVLRRRWLVIVSCTLLAAAAALAYSLTRPNEYSSTARLLFRTPQLSQLLFGTTPLAPEVDPTRAAATNAMLVGSNSVAYMTSRALNGAVSPAQVASEVTAGSNGQADIVSVTAKDRSPHRAALIANTYAQQFIAFSSQLDRTKILRTQRQVSEQYTAIPPASRNSPDAQALGRAARQLLVLASLQSGNAEFVQSASVPSVRSSPTPVKDALLGALAGLLIGIGLAFLLDRLDRRIRNSDEVEQSLRIPMLTGIPFADTIASRVPPAELSGAELEAFRLLRARLRYFNVDRQIRTVLITSAAPGEGKSTVALNLAAATAGTGSRVLLVEADLRRPTIGRQLNLDEGPGLAELLTQQDVTIDTAVRRVRIGQPENDGYQRTLEILPAGRGAPNPLELLESRQMRNLFTDLTAIYDFVVVDTPPTTAISDALPLVRRVDGVVVIVRIGSSTRDAVVDCVRQLRELHASVLGFVANAVPARDFRYIDTGRDPSQSEQPPEPDIVATAH